MELVLEHMLYVPAEILLAVGGSLSRSSKYAWVKPTRLRIITGFLAFSTCLSHYLGPPVVTLLKVRKLLMGLTAVGPVGFAVAGRADLLGHFLQVDAHEECFHSESALFSAYVAYVFLGHLSDVLVEWPVGNCTGDVRFVNGSGWHC